MLRSTIVFMTLLATACIELDVGNDDAAADGTTGASADAVPTSAMELSGWLADQMYTGWDAESAPHAATGNSPHGQVRTFVNEPLIDSLEAGNATHPVGSATVKEFYDDTETRTGWAVSVKVAEGDAADSWYWFQQMGDSVSTDGNGVAVCESCHNAGSDRVLTPFPLE